MGDGGRPGCGRWRLPHTCGGMGVVGPWKWSHVDPASGTAGGPYWREQEYSRTRIDSQLQGTQLCMMYHTPSTISHHA